MGKYLDVGTMDGRLEEVDDEALHDLYSSSNIVSTGAERGAVAFRAPSSQDFGVRRKLGRRRRSWQNNKKI
jgi:hypothetical protein